MPCKYFLFTRYSQDKRSKVPKLRYICHLVLVSEVLDHNPLPEKAFVWENSTCFDWNEKYLLPTIVKSKSINNYGVFKSFTTTFVWLFVIVLLSIIIRIIPTFQKEENFNFQLKISNTYIYPIRIFKNPNTFFSPSKCNLLSIVQLVGQVYNVHNYQITTYPLGFSDLSTALKRKGSGVISFY